MLMATHAVNVYIDRLADYYNCYYSILYLKLLLSKF